MRGATAVPLRARAFFLSTALVALATLAFLLPTSVPPWPSCVAGVLAIAITRYPLVLRQAGGLEIALDPVVILFLGFSDPTHAPLVWAMSAGLAHVVMRRALWVRVFNTAIMVLAGVAALAVIGALHSQSPTGDLRGGLAALAAALTYYAVDYTLSAVAIVLLGRSTLRAMLRDRTVPLALLASTGAGSLGYVAAVLQVAAPWTLPLATIPLGTVIMTGRAFAVAHGERMRVHALFTASERQHAAGTSEQVLAAAVQAGHEALATPVSLATTRPDDGISSRVSTPGGYRWLHASIGNQQSRSFTDRDRELLDVLASLTDDSLRRLALVTSLEELAGTDSLTGLPNGATFRRSVQAAGDHLAVLFLDLDGFKQINDDHGHESGDSLLRQVSERLLACVRSGDLVARNGGDEFAVLLPDTDEQTASSIAGRMVEALSRPIRLESATVTVGVSIGVAVGGSGDGSLVRRADVAMYAAKAAGKSQHLVCTESMYAAHEGRRILAEELRRAIEQDELVLHYQPIVNLALGRTDGFEALVRWNHPVRGRLAPDEFVPIAEDTGEIDALTRWVLARALADGALLSRAAGRQLSLSINISPSSIIRGVLLEQIAVGCSDNVQLVLEVTESAVSTPAAVPVLEEFRRRGVRIALDDFGAGHSSLAVLRLLPVDIIKLDRAFTQDICVDARAGALLACVADVSRALDKPLVVEGIEFDDQLRELQRLGVTLGQGYHLARPAPLHEVLAALSVTQQAVPA